jgi:K+-sensing histidine kinase KdpD
MQELGFKSAMIVPIVAREKLIGAITLVTSELDSARRYDEADMRFAEELARRAAISVENARLFTESQAVQRELRIVNEQKDEFLGMVSHELRTPVTIIYGSAGVLRNRGSTFDDESRDALIEDIDREAHRLRRLVEDMMVLARMELQHSNGSREPVQVHRTIERILRELRQRHPTQQLEVHIEGRLPAVAAEPTYFDQILRNLVTNAIKYAPAKPIEVRAHRNGGNEAVISVLDRGPGLRAEEITHIFERFYRSDHASSIGGTGLGLTVCKRLVEAQSGKIWAEPREGGGLAVNFSLPFYTDEH